jgi:hypothetical protein
VQWKQPRNWLIVGMLRGTTNEMLTYDLYPEESRERTDEGMELILRAWKEPQPFGWQGRHFRYRTVSVLPKPLQQPLPPVYWNDPNLSRGTDGLQTRRWREMDSNSRFNDRSPVSKSSHRFLA